MTDLGTALVTGGTSGIGLAIATGLQSNGFDVVVTGRQECALPEGVDLLLVDHLDPAAPEQIADRLRGRGPLRALVNNVGRRHGATLEELQWDSLQETLVLNTLGPIMLTRALVPLFDETGGAIVNVSSRLAVVGMPGVSGYAASKGGINAFTIAAAVELGPRGIRVNAIAPGMTKTPLIQDWLDEQPDAGAAEAEVAARIPLGALATPQDIAGAAVFLAGPESHYITGAVLPVDGGYTVS